MLLFQRQQAVEIPNNVSAPIKRTTTRLDLTILDVHRRRDKRRRRAAVSRQRMSCSRMMTIVSLTCKSTSTRRKEKIDLSLIQKFFSNSPRGYISLISSRRMRVRRIASSVECRDLASSQLPTFNLHSKMTGKATRKK